MANDDPLISIVIPAFNSGRFLGATLDSVVAQTERRWECIIVDDGSTDSTALIGETYCASDRRFSLIRTANRGAAAARNVGFRRSNPAVAYVTFMDSDDVWLPEALAVLYTAAEASATAIGAHGLAELVDAQGGIVGPGSYSKRGRRRIGIKGARLVEWTPDEPTDFAVLVNGNVLFPPGLVLAKRRAYDIVGPFDESFTGAEDWDMLIRLSRLGGLAFVDRVILHYRRHDRNLGAEPSVKWQAWLVRCKAFHSYENSRQQQSLARRGWRAYQLRLAILALERGIASVRRRRLGSALSNAARAVVHFLRCARGYPLPRVSRPAERW